MTATVVVGIDGMEPSLWTRWAKEGYLPNIAEISREGANGTADCSTVSSAAQWTTHFTGVTPKTHGVTGFERESDSASPPSENRPMGDTDRELITTNDIQAKTYPELLSDRGVTTGLVNALPLWPPVELDDGFCISGILTPPDADNWTHPESLADELIEHGYEIGVQYQDRPYGFLDDDIVGTVGLDTLWEDLLDVLEARIEYSKRALRNGETDLFYVLFKSIDAIQHVFWAPMEMADHRHTTVIRDAYAAVDEFIGWVRDELPEVNILVFGDHGFRARRNPPGPLNKVAAAVSDALPTVPDTVQAAYHRLTKETGTTGDSTVDHISGTHDSPTAWLAAGPDTQPADGLAVDFEDLTPTVYALLGEPIPEAYAGSPIEAALSCDVSYTDDSLVVERTGGSEGSVSERLYNLGYVDMVNE